MFWNAPSFEQKLCGAAWVRSNASKIGMFAGSPGSVSRTVCAFTLFSPRSKAELKSAAGTCLELSPEGDCFKGPHGLIEVWDVSRVTDMSKLFDGAQLFKGDISKWDVSSVMSMDAMFIYASVFEGDLSEWDVSSVTNMETMFSDATLFNGDISKWDVSSVTSMEGMFSGAK